MPEKGIGGKTHEKTGGVFSMLQLVSSRIPYGSTCFHEISYSSTQFHLLRSCDINAITTSNDPQPRHLTG